MPTTVILARPPTKWLIGLLVLFLAGCATPQIDWKARIGTYSYDDAVQEFGPPNKSARLADGTLIADWLTRPAQTVVAPEPYFLPPGGYFGPLTPTYTETHLPPRYLRLVFGPDGKLKSEKETGR